MARYDDHVLFAVDPATGLKRPIPRRGKDGTVICGWCRAKVRPEHTDTNVPWLCDDCGRSRAVQVMLGHAD